jgi:hypothetical protein
MKKFWRDFTFRFRTVILVGAIFSVSFFVHFDCIRMVG